MPNSGRRVGEQWEICQRCGRDYPMSQLVMQKGLLICIKRCFDNLTVERRDLEIQRVLGVGMEQEGVDMRVIDRAFFESAEELQ